MDFKDQRSSGTKEKKMGKTKLIVYMEKSMLSSIEKEAISEGKSKSEIASDLIGSALESRSGSGAGSTPGSDTDKIREAVSEAVMDLVKSVGHGIPPETLRFLIADVAKTENLLRQISLFLSPGNFKEHEERIRIAKHKSERILKKLKLDAVEDVDRIEIRHVEGEEAAQMLREMGIGIGKEDSK